MNKRLRFSPILLMAPFLLGATNTTTSHSNLLDYTVRGRIIKTGSKSVTVNSSRGKLMGTAVLDYEVIHYNDASYVYVNHDIMRYYTVNYRLTLIPEKNVQYANGLFNWFTATGDAAVKKVEVETTLKHKDGISELKNAAFSNANREHDYSLYLPSENAAAFGNMVDGAKYVYKSDSSANWYNNIVSTGSGDRIRTDDDDDYFTTVNGDSYSKTINAEYINRPQQTATFFGCYDFLSTNAKDEVKIVANAWFVIAEGGSWGSDNEMTPDLTVNISWNRPALLY